MKHSYLLKERASSRPVEKKQRRGKRRGVNITDVFDVLDRVPNTGAVYSLRLCVALPVDGDPAASMNFSGGLKAGHTFLVVGKEQGDKRVSRSFGFYPATRLSMWAPLDPHPSVIRDNRRHLAHAWLETPITALDFEVVRTLSIAGAWNGYLLSSFNCAGYAIEVFNSIRSEPLVLPPYPVHCWGVPIGYNRLPSRRPIVIPHTPQGLFLAIRSMAEAGMPDAHLAPNPGYRVP